MAEPSPTPLSPAVIGGHRSTPDGTAGRSGTSGRGWVGRAWSRRAARGSGSGEQGLVEPVRPTPLDFEISPGDPLLAYLLDAAAPVPTARPDLESPALEAMRAAGVAMLVPLVSSGELLGILTLGPRLSEVDYSTDDRVLLEHLASYAAPALKVSQLVEAQAAEARERERIDSELKVAQLIQQQFLPHELPDLEGWELAAFYRPARRVGGDFYDFIPLPDGRVMLVVGDVTDKGVPAALVMASTHALLRSAGPRLISPGAVLAQVNDLLCADIPAHMFVTCLALVLEPGSGAIEFANAGHDLPYVHTREGVQELRATGMPLGLMPGMQYEERQRRLDWGDCILLHSDGLAEAHNGQREMFGFPRVAELVGRGQAGEALLDLCLVELDRFTGPGHEQEDDITLVAVQRGLREGSAGTPG